MENREIADVASPISMLRRSARPRTATDYVSDSLRRSILNGDLVGGTRLSLAELAANFDVSTTPVREALRELSFEGLVRIDNYRGGVVTAVTKAEVEEIVRIRQVLEPMAAREAVEGMTSKILEEAQVILDEMAASDSWDVWVQGNRAFHRKLYDASSSLRLVSLIKSLQDTQVVFVSATLRKSPILKETATKDHNEMVDAARTGDVDRLIEITLRHLTIPIRD
ncbi:MAG: GntR family transcriptional regulator [Actinomycetota bacterium]|nr:GntR family transcriptional regulator [Actinomycetota bacterium]